MVVHQEDGDRIEEQVLYAGPLLLHVLFHDRLFVAALGLVVEDDGDAFDRVAFDFDGVVPEPAQLVEEEVPCYCVQC